MLLKERSLFLMVAASFFSTYPHSLCTHCSCIHRKAKFSNEVRAYKSSCCVRNSALLQGCCLVLRGFCSCLLLP